MRRFLKKQLRQLGLLTSQNQPSGGVLRHASVPLVNSAIKSLPTVYPAGIEFLEPGGLVIPILVLFRTRGFAAHPYTNLGSIGVEVRQGTIMLASTSDITESAQATYMMSGEHEGIWSAPTDLLRLVSLDRTVVMANGWNAGDDSFAAIAASPLRLAIYNEVEGEMAAFTGGHPDNTLTVSMLYTLMNAETGQFM